MSFSAIFKGGRFDGETFEVSSDFRELLVPVMPPLKARPVEEIEFSADGRVKMPAFQNEHYVLRDKLEDGTLLYVPAD